MNRRELEGIPWFTVVGALSLTGLLLHAANTPEFLSTLLPSYLTEFLLFVALGLELSGLTGRRFNEPGRHTLIAGMTAAWFLNQAVHWFWPSGFKVILMWGLAGAQAFLAYRFFTGEGLDLGFSFPLDLSLGLLTFFALGKVVLNAALNPLFLWGVAVLLVCLGHLLPRHGYRERSIQFLPAAGTLLAAWAAFTIQGPGLSLLTI